MYTRGKIVPALVLASLAALIAFAGCGKEEASDQPVTLNTERDKYSYAVGVNIGTNFRDGYVDVDPAVVAKAMADVLEKRDLLMTEEEMTQSMTVLQNTIQERYTGIVTENGKKASDFLAQNAKKQGVTMLPDSLQYEILTAGTGPKPTMGDSVRVHYEGKLLDGTIFDSSIQRGEPVVFTLDQVIPGWTEALTLMPAGSKWRVYIPPQLAYGEEGRPGIPPNALLIFDIELIGVI